MRPKSSQGQLPKRLVTSPDGWRLVALAWQGLQYFDSFFDYLILSELVTTNKLDSAMAAAPYIGFSRPSAAIGIPITL